MATSLYRSLLGCALVALSLGCQAKIGDECRQSRQCSIRGERVCDLSVRVNASGIRTNSGDGECTIEGCGRGTCPKEATCVRVYGSDFLSTACDPDREDLATVCESSTCPPGDECPMNSDGVRVCPPLNECDANEICLPEGLCADEITARTSCRRKCKDNGDCREGYECKSTGSDGIYRVFDADNPTDDSQISICRPVETSP